jgi:hemerythrin-like domain-containing protein
MTASDAAADGAIRAPLEFLTGHHDRQSAMCAGLERLARDPGAADAAATARLLLDYLIHELPLHVADEEEDLLPLLARCATEEDGIDTLLAQILSEHEGDTAFEACLTGPLEAIAAGRLPARPEIFARDAVAFATMQRRHVAWENGTIIPLARLRLGAGELARLAAAMTARRRA